MSLAPLNHSAVATSIFPHLCPPSSSPSSSSLPSFNPALKLKRRNSTGWRVRCSVATVSPSKVNDSGNPFPTFDCVVVGAGISGLCTAQALSSSCPNLLVTEARDRVGGNITTVEREGYLWEEGPNSFQPSEPVLRMVVDCGLKDDLVLGDPNAPRFVFWNGKLRPVPSKPADLPFFDLMSFPGKLRAGFGAIGFRPPPPVCSPYPFVELLVFSPFTISHPNWIVFHSTRLFSLIKSNCKLQCLFCILCFSYCIFCRR